MLYNGYERSERNSKELTLALPEVYGDEDQHSPYEPTLDKAPVVRSRKPEAGAKAIAWMNAGEKRPSAD